MGTWYSSEKFDEEKWLEEYKEKVNTLDVTVTGLLTAIDLMTVTAKPLEKDIQMNIDPKDQVTSASIHEQNYRENTDRLLTTFKNAVLLQRKSTIGSIISLTDFINKTITDNASSESEGLPELNLKKYKYNSKKQVSQTHGEHISCLTENQALKIKHLKDKIILLKERESTFIKEKEALYKEIEALKISHKENEDLKSKINRLRAENERTLRQHHMSVSSFKEQDETLKKANEQQVKGLQEKIECLKNKKRGWKQKFQKCECRVESFKKDNTDLEKAKSMLEQDLKAKEQLLKDTKDELTKINNLEKDLRSRNETMEISVKGNEREAQRLRHDVHEKEKEIQRLEDTLAKEKDEKDRLDKDLKLRIKTFEDVQEKLDELSSIKPEYENLQLKVEDLKGKLQAETEKNEKEMMQKDEEMKALKLQIRNMESEEMKQRQSHASELKSISDKNKDLEKALKEKDSYLETTQRTLESEKRRHESDCRQKNEHLEKWKEKLRVALDVSSNERKSFTSQKQTLENKLQASEKELRDKRTEIRRTEKELQVEKENVKKFQDECLSRKVELGEKLNIIRTNEEKISEIGNQREQLSRSLKAVQEELDNLKRRKVIPVQLYCQKRSDLINNIEERLTALLQKSFISKRLELEFWKCSRLSEIKPQFPLLVVCITVSRIGTDVANALHGLPLSSNMAVTIFHHKDEHALPSQLSERVLTGKELRGIGGIFDMAYFSDKGIYPCEMNSNSADSLVTFIKRVARDMDTSK